MEIQEGSRVNGSFFGQSAFASFAVATPKNLVKLGLTEADIGGRIGFGRLLSLAALTCGVQTGSGTVWNVLRPQKQSSIAVFGCGAVGLSAIMASKISGCERIIAVDKNADRLKVALELGATEISIPERFASRVSGADQQLDYAVDTTGVPEVLEKGFLGLRTGGSAVLLGGSPAGSEIKIPMLNLLLGRSIKGVIQGEAVSQDHIAKLIEHNLQGDFPFEKMIRVYKGLDKIDEAFADSKSGAVIKPIITINP